MRAEGDQAAGELFFLEAIGVADFVIDFLQALQCGIDFDDFHCGIGNRQSALGTRRRNKESLAMDFLLPIARLFRYRG